VADYLLLSLRFRARYREPMLHEVAGVMEDIEAAYYTAHRFTRDENLARQGAFSFATAFNAEKLALSGGGGFSEDVLAEVEYTSRAIQRLERSGAEEWVLGRLRNGLEALLDQQNVQLRFGQLPGRVATPVAPLEMRRLSMASPLDILVGIPPEYWKGGGLVLFLAALESRFNMVGRIRVERANLRADLREAELRERTAARALEELEHGGDVRPPVPELEQPDAPFQLEEGEVRAEDVDSHGASQD